MAVPLFAIGFPNLLGANGVRVSGGSWLPAAPVTNVANGKLKPDAAEQQLYNLADDPGQTKNVIREHPEIAKRMFERLTAIQSGKKGL